MTLMKNSYHRSAIVGQVQIFFGQLRTVKYLVEQRAHVAIVSIFARLEFDVVGAKEKLEASAVRHVLFVDQVIEVVFQYFLGYLPFLDGQYLGCRVLFSETLG